MGNAKEYWITARGITRLDGARGKKQVWRPCVRTWAFSESNSLYRRKQVWYFWDFSAPSQSFGAAIGIRCPGNCAPLPPVIAPLTGRQDFCFYCMFKTFFLGTTNCLGAMPSWVRAWGKLWRSKYQERNSQKRWDCIHIANFVEARALNFTNFFVAMQRNGIKTSVTAFSYICALGFTGQSSRKTLRASTWNKSSRVKSEQPSFV